MSRITILTPSEKAAFDSRLKFNDDDKALFFLVDGTLDSILSGLGSNINRIGFLLQWGYFKACGRFFAAEEFNCDDIQYVCTALNIPYRDTVLSEYKERTFRYHQQKICQYFQYTPFDNVQKQALIAQIAPLVEQCIRPKNIIFTLAQQFRYEKCVQPSFDIFCRLITDAYNQFETRLLLTLKTSLTKTQRASLDELLPPAETKKKPYQRAKLSLLKRLNQAVRLTKINASLDDCALIAHLYTPFETLIAELNLTDQAVQYYAGWVFKATAAQVKQFPAPMKRYLHLIAFVAHQYHNYQDNFSDIMLKAV